MSTCDYELEIRAMVSTRTYEYVRVRKRISYEYLVTPNPLKHVTLFDELIITITFVNYTFFMIQLSMKYEL